MNSLGLGPYIILYHVLPSILAALIYLLLAWFFIFIFRIRKSSAKFVIYSIVLYKSFLLLATGARFSTTIVPRKPFLVGISLYDPLNLIPFSSIGPIKEAIKNFSVKGSPFYVTILTIVLILVVLLLILRWVAMVFLLRKLTREEKQLKNSSFKTLEKLALKLKVKTPQLIVSRKNVGPLTLGLIRPKIILSENFIKNSTAEELEVVLGHELAHIKRRDNIWQWLILFMKDILFFNPFAILAYKLLQVNKEKASDIIYLNVAPDKSFVLSNTLKKLISGQKETSKPSNRWQTKSSFFSPSDYGKRLSWLNNYLAAKNTLRVKITNCLAIMFFFWLKVLIAVKIAGKALLLLS